MARQEPITQKVKSSDVRQQWSRLLDEVRSGDVRVVVERSGIAVAGIVSAADLERLTQLEQQRAERFKALEDSWEAFKDVPVEEIESEVAKAVAAARQRVSANAE
jgi:prevent-host-death family protein